MADSFTVHRNYTKPEDGASADTWGVKLNNDFDSIDTDVYALLTDANYDEDTGAANALLINPTPAWTEYKEGSRLWVLVNATNTGSTTINVSSLGVKNVLANDGTNLNAGELQAGGVYMLVFDGTQFKTASKAPLATSGEIATGTSGSKVMTPAAFFGNALDAANGYYELPGGILVQWGFVSLSITVDGAWSISFPKAFATACRGVWATPVNASSGDHLDFWAQIVSLNTTGASMYMQMAQGATGTVTGAYWLAIGK